MHFAFFFIIKKIGLIADGNVEKSFFSEKKGFGSRLILLEDRLSVSQVLVWRI